MMWHFTNFASTSSLKAKFSKGCFVQPSCMKAIQQLQRAVMEVCFPNFLRAARWSPVPAPYDSQSEENRGPEPFSAERPAARHKGGGLHRRRQRRRGCSTSKVPHQHWPRRRGAVRKDSRQARVRLQKGGGPTSGRRRRPWCWSAAEEGLRGSGYERGGPENQLKKQRLGIASTFCAS